MNADNTMAHVLEFEIEATADEVDGRCHFMLNRKQFFLFFQAIQQDTTQSSPTVLAEIFLWHRACGRGKKRQVQIASSSRGLKPH